MLVVLWQEFVAVLPQGLFEHNLWLIANFLGRQHL